MILSFDLSELLSWCALQQQTLEIKYVSIVT